MNETFSRVSEELKPILREFIDNCSVIKVWISLLVPKMEDGNNFGVSIQAEVRRGEGAGHLLQTILLSKENNLLLL